MSDEQIIYHMVAASYYDSQPADQPYRSQRLEEEGFIHCTKGGERVLLVANTVHRKTPGKFWLLVIDERKVKAEIRYEIVGEILFPHIYGPLNRDAILRVQEMGRAEDGTFLSLGVPPEAEGPLSAHPAALAAEASIEDVLAETRRLRRLANERIIALEQEIEAFRQGKPAPVEAAAPVQAREAEPAPMPAEVEALARRLSKLEKKLVDLHAILADRLDKLEARLAALEKKKRTTRKTTRSRSAPSKATPGQTARKSK